MSEATRRGFLVFAGVGTAAAAGAVAGSSIFGDRSVDAVDAAAGIEPADLAGVESFVVHVKDVRKGELAILVGEREVLVTDRELAARLAGVTTTA
ncbi:twin-arginine translocation signal domain-containing protein [Kribbella sp. NPDC026611]|uniref:twin-arginine translocation signal domain-containing protein n=1 Tax=Kribbella sp. NPDC026611 TaxID=3154911 RepID=UPI0033F19AE0